MKRKTTKEIIGESFLELAQKERIDKITITNITDNCQLSQPTFYNHFKDKTDLILWLYSQNAKEILDKIDGEYTWRDSLKDTIKEVKKNKEITLNAVESSTWQRNFIRMMMEANSDFMVKEIQKKLQYDKIPDELFGIVRVFCYGSTQYIFEWLKNGTTTSEEEVFKIIEGSVPEVLKEYLF